MIIQKIGGICNCLIYKWTRASNMTLNILTSARTQSYQLATKTIGQKDDLLCHNEHLNCTVTFDTSLIQLANEEINA